MAIGDFLKLGQYNDANFIAALRLRLAYQIGGSIRPETSFPVLS